MTRRSAETSPTALNDFSCPAQLHLPAFPACMTVAPWRALLLLSLLIPAPLAQLAVTTSTGAEVNAETSTDSSSSDATGKPPIICKQSSSCL